MHGQQNIKNTVVLNAISDVLIVTPTHSQVFLISDALSPGMNSYRCFGGDSSPQI